MKKIYLDWNVINHLEENPELYDYILQNQSHFVFVYSPAHFSDLMKSYTEDGSNEYFERDLERLETVCETHLMRYYDKKIGIHRCSPREFLEKEGKDYPVSKYLLHFDEIKESLKIGELDLYDIFCESLKTIRLDKEMELPLLGTFSNAYELLNLSIEFFKKLMTDEKYVKNVRVGGTNIVGDKELSNINNYNPNEVVRAINGFLSSQGSDFDMEELIKKNTKSEHKDDEKIFFESLYVSLDLMRYHPDKRDLMNILTDADHAFYGKYCDVLVTDDAKMSSKTEAVYSYLGVDTKVLEKKELLQYLKNEIVGEFEIEKPLKEVLSNQHIPETYNEETCYGKCKKLDCHYLGYFNKLEFLLTVSTGQYIFVFSKKSTFEKCVYYTEIDKFFAIMKDLLHDSSAIKLFETEYVEKFKLKDKNASFSFYFVPQIRMILSVEEENDSLFPILYMVPIPDYCMSRDEIDNRFD